MGSFMCRRKLVIISLLFFMAQIVCTFVCTNGYEKILLLPLSIFIVFFIGIFTNIFFLHNAKIEFRGNFIIYSVGGGKYYLNVLEIKSARINGIFLKKIVLSGDVLFFDGKNINSKKYMKIFKSKNFALSDIFHEIRSIRNACIA